ncbi:MAG: transcription elongation factor GreA [Candidatus Harrisonbacteria bacterium CG10_big_fil_rev_8_21_14_0_10_40_38]|uniref:Transcription elongation factor GreA n=1 Tax=Candidatus Harrisonbacteria bacterium CG10_big_fil_rev_8_21_14_0_10_40_38 TaxID=1974583 RepID=A0A2H0USG2_9BACT|nr:MAG: transcription elongation factor GreA [Candidatus Harrisonbacteria bacterium CG10_big_fil_rev_8_21_14_0_10_40_38]
MEYYLTAERLEEIKKELEILKTERRLEVAKRLKRAKELGDLSENSEYIEAREEQSRVERQIFEYEQMVKNTILITKPVENVDTIQIGSTFEVEKEGTKTKFTIVGSNEAKPEAGLISNESPLGKSFLGKRVGDKVSVKVPKGEVTYKITNIE